MAKKPIKKRRKVRLLPVTVTMLSLLLIIKVNEVYIGSRQLREMYSVRDAVAEEKKEPVKEEAAIKEVEPAKEGEKKEEAGHVEEKKEEAGHGEAKEESGHGSSAKPVEEPKTYGTGKSTVKQIEELKAREEQPRFSKTELDLLENLSKRREELDTRERDIEIKAKVLEAAEKQLNDKIGEMKTLQADLAKIVTQYNEKQDNQLKSLVKIYESMKPDEAAKIFDEMEMPILLDVIGKMSERKVAPVLANMSPKKAKDVTQELAEKRKKVSDASTAAAKP